MTDTTEQCKKNGVFNKVFLSQLNVCLEWSEIWHFALPCTAINYWWMVYLNVSASLEYNIREYLHDGKSKGGGKDFFKGMQKGANHEGKNTIMRM